MVALFVFSHDILRAKETCSKGTGANVCLKLRCGRGRVAEAADCGSVYEGSIPSGHPKLFLSCRGTPLVAETGLTYQHS